MPHDASCRSAFMAVSFVTLAFISHSPMLAAQESHGDSEVAERLANELFDQAFQALHDKPNDVTALENRAWALWRLDERQRAFIDLHRLRELDIYEYEITYARCLSYSNQDRDALQILTTAVSRRPNDYRGYFERAMVDETPPNRERILRDLTEAKRLVRKESRDYEHICRGRAYELFNQDRYAESIEDFTIAIFEQEKRAAQSKEQLAAHDSSHYQYVHRAKAHALLSDHVSAIDDFSKALSIRADSDVIFEFRANSYEAIGDHIKAKADRETAREMRKRQGE